jgi:Superfamily II DNA/RNA helicase required for DNA uptake (late competence protein)
LLSPKYFFYLAIDAAGQGKVDMSSNPRVDAFLLSQQRYYEIYILRPPQPIWIMEIVLPQLRRSLIAFVPAKFHKLASTLIREIQPQRKLTMQRHNIEELKLAEFDPPAIGPLLWGRSLLETEIVELLSANGQEVPWDPEDWLQYLYLQSQVQREAAVGIDSLGLPFCRRCGERKDIMEDNCIFCGNLHCYTCNNCRNMGLAKSCIPLYFQSYPEGPKLQENIQPQLQFELTPPQQRASDAVEKFLISSQSQFLVWAVCGAGKTEVSYGALAKALSIGAKVLFAIPRKDVVIELLPRLQQAFPEIAVSGLYGGSGERFQDASLTVATTHQCLRFYQSFDLIILDEADAFPYQGSAMLHFAVQRALKPGGHLVIMTATPNKDLIHKARGGKLAYVSIPARHHRKPLIVPQIWKLDTQGGQRIGKLWEPPELIRQFIMGLKEHHHRGLVFLPTIRLIEEYGVQLIHWAATKGIPADFAHSQADSREDVKARLLRGEITLIVTSTIFERGVTIPNLDVLVLYADNETIFDSQCLIQIAGRAGRLGEAGQVIFAAKTHSHSMKEAVKIIKEMNKEGFELGYLDSEF